MLGSVPYLIADTMQPGVVNRQSVLGPLTALQELTSSTDVRGQGPFMDPVLPALASLTSLTKLSLESGVQDWQVMQQFQRQLVSLQVTTEWPDDSK